MVALVGTILQYVWRIQEMFPPLALIQFTTLVSLAAILLFAIDRDAVRKLGRLRHKLFLPILVIFVLAGLSIPLSVHAGSSLQFFTGNFAKTILLVAVIAASARDRTDVDRLVRFFVVGGVIYVVAAMAATTAASGRLGGGSYDPNDLGLFTVITLPFCVYLMRSEATRGDRILGFVAAPILLLGTALSGSRGGFLALVAVAFYGVVALDAVRLHKRVMVPVVAIAILLAVAGDTYVARMQTLLAPQQDYNWSGQAESGRIEIWKRGLDYMARRPLLGVGVDQFPTAEGTMAPQAERQAVGVGFKWSTAHNMYIQIGAELGVFGLVAFVTLLTLAYREGRLIGRTALAKEDRLLGQAFATLLVGFAVGGSFLSQAYAPYFYFSVAVLIGFSRVVARGTHTSRVAVPADFPTFVRPAKYYGSAARVRVDSR